MMGGGGGGYFLQVPDLLLLLYMHIRMNMCMFFALYIYVTAAADPNFSPRLHASLALSL